MAFGTSFVLTYRYYLHLHLPFHPQSSITLYSYSVTLVFLLEHSGRSFKVDLVLPFSNWFSSPHPLLLICPLKVHLIFSFYILSLFYSRHSIRRLHLLCFAFRFITLCCSEPFYHLYYLLLFLCTLFIVKNSSSVVFAYFLFLFLFKNSLSRLIGWTSLWSTFGLFRATLPHFCLNNLFLGLLLLYFRSRIPFHLF